MNSHRLSNKLKSVEEANGEAMIVFLSDVWLDQLKVLNILNLLITVLFQLVCCNFKCGIRLYKSNDQFSYSDL